MSYRMVASSSLRRSVIAFAFLCISFSTLSTAHGALSLESEAYLKDASIVQGANNSGDLMLAKEINRAELMKIVVKTVVNQDPTVEEYNNCFPDVHKEWFAPYICWAKFQGYVQGYEDGMFHPGKAVTEAEALKIINNALSIGVDNYVPSSRPWYEGYYNAALKRNLVGRDTADRLASPALRGDVFEQLARALTVSELQKESFSKGDTELLPSRNSENILSTTLPTEKLELLSAISSTLDYGYQPQSGSGTGLIKIAIAAGDSRANISVSMGQISLLTGTKDTLDKAQATLTLHADVNVNAMGETIGFIADAKGTVIVEGISTLYLRLDQLTVVNTDTSDVLKDMITSITTETAPYIGKWYYLPMDDSVRQELHGVISAPTSQDALKESMKVLDKYFEESADFILVDKKETSINGISADRYIITVDGASLVRQIPRIAGKFSTSPMNTYEVRKDLKMAKPYIEKFFANFSTEIIVNKTNHLIIGTNTTLTPTSFILPAELTGGSVGSIMLEILGVNEYSYPTSVTIEIPKNAEDLSTTLNTNNSF